MCEKMTLSCASCATFWFSTIDSQDPIENFPLKLLHISLEISYENLMFYLEKNSNLISLLDNAWILEGEVTRESLLGVKGLTHFNLQMQGNMESIRFM